MYVRDRDGRFGSKVGQIGPKWDKSLSSQMYWNLTWKSPGFVPFWANLTHLGAKPTIPVPHIYFKPIPIVTSPGSAYISRETTIDSYSPILIRARSASWCECTPVDSGQCPECRMTRGHERWCTYGGSVCHNCQKPRKSSAHAQGSGSIRSSENSGHAQRPTSLQSRELPGGCIV